MNQDDNTEAMEIFNALIGNEQPPVSAHRTAKLLSLLIAHLRRSGALTDAQIAAMLDESTY